MDEGEGITVRSLPLLQERIRKDPIAYEKEFLLEFEHFQSTLPLLAIAPQKPNKSFLEIVSFLALTCPHYRSKVEDFISMIESTIVEHSETLHVQTRRALISAIMLCRGRRVFPPLRILPLFLQLLGHPDKELRTSINGFLVRDFVKSKELKKATGQTKVAYHKLLLSQLHDSTSRVCAVRTARLLIDLYRSGAWRDPFLVNAVADLCFSPSKKLAFCGTRFLLGEFNIVFADESDDDDDESKIKMPRKAIGSKNTAGKAHRLERKIQLTKRKVERRQQRDFISSNFTGAELLDLLYDPHSFTEKLLDRLLKNKHSDSFQLKLCLMNLVSRLIGKFKMQLPTFYPFIQRYINPKQREITSIFAYVVQAAHSLVPPEDIQRIIDNVVDQFVVDYQSPEVITVGLNAIREICARAPHALTEETLGTLVDYRKNKHKSIVAGARSLLNLYRDIYPELLEKQLRGKTAATEVSHSKAPRAEFAQLFNDFAANEEDGSDATSESGSEYGSQVASSEGGSLDEADSWTESEDGGGEGEEDNESEVGSCDGSEDGSCDGSEAPTLVDLDERESRKRKRSAEDLTSHILTNEDFKRMRKRSGSVSSDSSDEISEGMPECIVAAESLAAKVSTRIPKDARMNLIQINKEERKQLKDSFRNRAKNMKGCLPNSVKARFKPMMMVKQKREIKDKSRLDSASKLTQLRRHIKNVKKVTGKKVKYRRN